MSAEILSLDDDPRERKRFYFQDTFLRRVLTNLLKFVFSIITRIEVEGAEYLPVQGPVILAANHLTNFDVFPMQFVLPRLIFFMGKEELFRNPLLDLVFRRLGGFPVYRGARDQWAIRQAERVLEHQQILGIFPEGSRSKGRGLRTAKTGAARLALSTGVPIVPLAVTGTEQIARRFPRRTQVLIKLGPAIIPDEDETALELTDRLMFTLAEMLPPGLRGVYASHPPGF